MEKIFNRSLIGYQPQWVSKKIEELKNRFESDKSKLMKDLDGNCLYKVDIREKINHFQDEINSVRTLEERINNILFKAHSDTAQKIMEAEQKIQKSVQNKLNEISQLEKEKTGINLSISELIKDLRKKVEYYETDLKADANEKGKVRDVL